MLMVQMSAVAARCPRSSFSSIPLTSRLCVPLSMRVTNGCEKGKRMSSSSSKVDWQCEETCRGFMDRVRVAHDIKEREDWSRVTTKDIVALGGSGLLKRHGHSILQLLQKVLPEEEFEAGDRAVKPSGYWQKESNIEKFVKHLMDTYDIQYASDWKRVGNTEVMAQGGAALLRDHGGSSQSLLQAIVPELKELDPLIFRSRVKRGWWDERENRVAFVQRVAKEMNVRERRDWQGVTCQDVRRHGGGGLLVLYNNSMTALLKDTLDEDCDEAADVMTLRGHVPRGFWASKENQRSFLDKVMKELKIERNEDWKGVTTRKMKDLGGTGLLARYDGSLFSALQALYPERRYLAIECCAKVPQGYWEDKANRMDFVDRLADRFSVTTASEWKRVKAEDVHRMGGATLLFRYSSFTEMIADNWRQMEGEERDVRELLMTRSAMPASFWKEEANVREFIHRMEREAGIEILDDWYRVSQEEIRENKGAGLLVHSSLLDALTMVYPNHKWKPEEFGKKAKRSTQRRLLLAVRALVLQDPVAESTITV